MKLIIFCGISIEEKCGTQRHPLSDVKLAIELIEKGQDATIYSNSPDYVTTIKDICDIKGIDYEFYLNGVYKGKELGDIFEDFNTSFKYLEDYSINLKSKQNGI